MQYIARRHNDCTYDGLRYSILFLSFDLYRIYDSEPFIFAGYRWRLTFGRYSDLGFGLMVGLGHRVNARVSCEFRVHCQLKPPYSKKSKGNYCFSPASSYYRGFRHFIGAELLSYVDNGRLTISVIMCTEIGDDGTLIGVSGACDDVEELMSEYGTQGATTESLNENSPF